RRDIVHDGTRLAVTAGQDGQDQTGRHEAGGQNRRCPGEEVGAATGGHETATAATTAANAKSAAFAALDQNDTDQHQSQKAMDDQDDRGHEKPAGCPKNKIASVVSPQTPFY